MRVKCVKAAYGSRPWFAVPEGTANPSGPDAVWLQGGATVIQTQAGPVTTDGALRFFRTRGALVAAIETTGYTVAWRTLHTK